MENIELFKTMKRYCKTNSYSECGFKYICETQPDEMESEKIQIAIDFIEKWSIDNPVKTRQSEFLKLYPNATLDSNGNLIITPCSVNKELYNKSCEKCKYMGYSSCNKSKYWNEEIE